VGKIVDLDQLQEEASKAMGAPPKGLYDQYEAGEEEPLPDVYANPEEDLKAEETMSDMKSALKSAFLGLQERYAREDRLAGIETGFTELDDIIDGWQRQTVTLVGARSGMGKSFFGLNLGLQMASRGHMVDYITIEMPTKNQSMRAMFCWSGVESNKMKLKTMGPDDWNKLVVAINQMRDFPWLWDERGSTTIDQIRRQIQLVKAKAVANGNTLHTVIVDHILNIQGSVGKKDRREQVLYITNQLKAIAKAEDVCMVGLTQINRGVEGRKCKRPTISDLKESGSSEEDADNILLLYREDYYKKDKSSWNHILECDVAKVREGETGVVKFREDFGRCRISPIVEEGF
jgi:replicative DNA helicase